MSRTLILGAGFGGISVATELRRLLEGDHEVVLVDRAERFAMGLRKLWELVGQATIADGSRPRASLRERGIDVVRSEIRAIDPAARAVETDAGRLEGDHMVVALGAVSRPDLVPGLEEHGHDVWSFAGVPSAASALARFSGGRIVVLIAGAPYPCPPAPFECAMHLHEHLRARGIRERSEIELSTVQPMLMPNAGREGSEWMAARLAERGIAWRVASPVTRVEEGRVVLAEGELAFDLLIAVPPHRPPPVVTESGLTGESGWIDVDPGTLETDRPGVFAIGDVTRIRLANGLPLPKAGVIAERQGERVAAAIAAQVRGAPAPPAFTGTGRCFVEIGADAAATVDGEFYATPEPRIVLSEPDAAHAREKRLFESELLERWFGG